MRMVRNHPGIKLLEGRKKETLCPMEMGHDDHGVLGEFQVVQDILRVEEGVEINLCSSQEVLRHYNCSLILFRKAH